MCRNLRPGFETFSKTKSSVPFSWTLFSPKSMCKMSRALRTLDRGGGVSFVVVWVNRGSGVALTSLVFVLASFTPEVDTCQIDVGGDEGMFSSSDIPEERLQLVDTYNIAIDCMWVITVKEGWKVSRRNKQKEKKTPQSIVICVNSAVIVGKAAVGIARQNCFLWID